MRAFTSERASQHTDGDSIHTIAMTTDSLSRSDWSRRPEEAGDVTGRPARLFTEAELKNPLASKSMDPVASCSSGDFPKRLKASSLPFLCS